MLQRLKPSYYARFSKVEGEMCPKAGCIQVQSASFAELNSMSMTILGVALRMAEALGIHEDHLQPPVSTGPSGTLPVDFESGRRMSLTLSISDKFPPIP